MVYRTLSMDINTLSGTQHVVFDGAYTGTENTISVYCEDMLSAAYNKGYDDGNPVEFIDWLQISATGARMNTEYFPTNHTGFKLVAIPTVTQAAATPVCGERYQQTGYTNQKLVIWQNNNQLAINFGNVDSGYLATAKTTLNQEFTFEFKQESESSTNMLLKFNGTTIKTYTQAQIGTFTSITPIAIGTIYTDPRAGNYYDTRFWNGLKIKEFDLYEGTELVRRYVSSKSGNIPIFFDTITRKILPQQSLISNFWNFPTNNQ